MRMMLNRRDNGEDGKTENTQGRPDSSYSLQELLIFPQPMVITMQARSAVTQQMVLSLGPVISLWCGFSNFFITPTTEERK